MVEDVDQHEVGERAVRVRQALRVDHVVGPGRRLDVGGDDEREALLELADAGAQLDGLAGDAGELAPDLLEPLQVEPADERAAVPRVELGVQGLAEVHCAAPFGSRQGDCRCPRVCRTNAPSAQGVCAGARRRTQPGYRHVGRLAAPPRAASRTRGTPAAPRSASSWPASQSRPSAPSATTKCPRALAVARLGDADVAGGPAGASSAAASADSARGRRAGIPASSRARRARRRCRRTGCARGRGRSSTPRRRGPPGRCPPRTPAAAPGSPRRAPPARSPRTGATTRRFRVSKMRSPASQTRAVTSQGTTTSSAQSRPSARRASIAAPARTAPRRTSRRRSPGPSLPDGAAGEEDRVDVSRPPHPERREVLVHAACLVEDDREPDEQGQQADGGCGGDAQPHRPPVRHEPEPDEPREEREQEEVVGHRAHGDEGGERRQPPASGPGDGPLQDERQRRREQGEERVRPQLLPVQHELEAERDEQPREPRRPEGEQAPWRRSPRPRPARR